jgi:hypothetical protein
MKYNSGCFCGPCDNIKRQDKETQKMDFALQEAAKAWCGAKTSSKLMDAELAQEFANILIKHMYEPHLGCATTKELLDEIYARSNLEYSTYYTDCDDIFNPGENNE